MRQLPVFSASPQIPEFDCREDLRVAVARAVPTLGRLSTQPAPQRSAVKRNAAARPDSAAGFSMSGFG